MGEAPNRSKTPLPMPTCAGIGLASPKWINGARVKRPLFYFWLLANATFE